MERSLPRSPKCVWQWFATVLAKAFSEPWLFLFHIWHSISRKHLFYSAGFNFTPSISFFFSSLSLSLPLSLSISLSPSLSLSLPLSLSLSPFISLYLSIYLSIYLSTIMPYQHQLRLWFWPILGINDLYININMSFQNQMISKWSIYS